MPFEQLNGLLSQDNPMMDLGLGLLSQSGPVVGAPAPSLGQAFGNAAQFVSQRDQQRFENNAIRGELAARKSQRDAMSQLPGLLSDPNATQDQVLGLLATGAPDMFSQGLMGQYFAGTEAPRTSTAYTEFQQLYPNLAEGSPEFAAAWEEYRGTSNSALKEQLDLAERQLAFQVAQAEANETQRTIESQESAVVDSFEQLVGDAELMFDANNTLRGTFLESGRVGSEEGGFREFLASIGAETGIYDQDTVNAHNEFNKFANSFAIRFITSLENATNQQFTVLKDSLANLGVDPDTNNKILTSVVRQGMDQTIASGFDIPQPAIDAANSFIERVESYVPPQTRSLSDMTDAELRALERSLGGSE